MTRDEAIHALVEKAYSQVGYREGANNWNKYAADPRITKLFGWDLQNQPWCAVFTHWLFIDTFEFENGVAMTYGGSAACRYDADFFKNHGAWSTVPEKGAVIYFYANGAINHQGVVVDVSGATITTVEGNYSDMVSKNTYYTGDSAIAGYGIPNWDLVTTAEPSGEDDDEPDLTYFSSFSFSKGYGIGDPKPEVKIWQSFLAAWGYDLGRYGIDGEFGNDTYNATLQWQQKAKDLDSIIVVDGQVDNDDWDTIVWIPKKLKQ